jgi:hypothetical protein
MLIGDGPSFREQCDGETMELFTFASMQRTEHPAFGFVEFVDRFRGRLAALRRKLDAVRAAIFHRTFPLRKAGCFESVDQFNGRRPIDAELGADRILPLRSIREKNPKKSVFAQAQLQWTKCLFYDTRHEITERRKREIGTADQRSGIGALAPSYCSFRSSTHRTCHANYLFFSTLQPCTGERHFC